MAGHVARIGEMRNAYKMLVGNLKGGDHLEELSVDGKTLLEWMLEKYVEKVLIGFVWLRIRNCGGLL
jgi:hypothetical protein